MEELDTPLVQVYEVVMPQVAAVSSTVTADFEEDKHSSASEVKPDEHEGSRPTI